MKARAVLLGMLLFMPCCGRYVERERETGHRGEARLNPFLAAERFLAALGHQVESSRRWPSPDEADAMLVVPAAMLGAEGFVREAAAWVGGGGHLVCLFAHGDRNTGDWRLAEDAATVDLPGPLREWLREEAGVEVRTTGLAGSGRRVIVVAGEAFEVTRTGWRRFEGGPGLDGDGGVVRSVASWRRGEGRVTLVSDARVFRNRFLGEAENASLLAWLAELSREGATVFVHGSGVSIWQLLWRHGWPAITGLVGWLGLVLWRWTARFGPCDEGLAVDERRDYTRHLRAVGGFYWRFDRGAGLLGRLREEAGERLQRRRAAAGGTGDDLFALAEAISGVPRERVQLAMSGVARPDPADFTRVTADLQQLLKTL